MAASTPTLKQLFEHPHYEESRDDLRKFKALYEAKHKVLSTYEYLWPHELELSEQPIQKALPDGQVAQSYSDTVGSKLRRIRVVRSRFPKIAESIVGLWISFMLGKDGSVALDEAAKAMLKEDEQDIDDEGTTFQDFVKWKVAPSYLIYGQPYVLVDAPPNDFKTEKEKLDAGWRPFMAVLDPLEVKDWQIPKKGKDRGQFNLIRWEYGEIEERSDLEDKPACVQRCRKLRLADGGLESTVYRYQDGKRPGEQPGWEVESVSTAPGWRRVPVSTVVGNESWLDSVADMILVAYNLMSAHWNGLNGQAFQRLFATGKLTDRHAISMSEYAVAILPDGADIKVIEPSNPQALVAAISAVVDYVYRLAFNRTRTLATDSKDAPAADTLKEMRQEMLELLRSAIGEIEGLMNQALKDYALYKLGPDEGKKFAGKVTLSRDLTVEDFDKQLEIWAVARDDIKKVLPWYQATMRKLLAEQKLTEEEAEEIKKAIDALKPEDVNPMLALSPMMPLLPEEDGQEEAEAPGGPKGRGDGIEGGGPGRPAGRVPPQKPA